jgi:apolipoprotein N-acyltransferase
VQGNISSYERWDGRTASDFRGVYHRLTKEASEGVPGGLVLWPENAVPININREGTHLRELADGMNRTLVAFALDTDFFGHDGYQIEEGEGPIKEESIGETRFYNAGFVVDPEGEIRGRISKTHLVIMGEAVPFRNILPQIMDEYPWGDRDFNPGGQHEEMLPIDSPLGRIGLIVCYESFFPNITRRLVNQGAILVCEGTNTSWFYDRDKVVDGYYQNHKLSWPRGCLDASIQHADNDIFRSVECGVFLARAASTGVSSLIDPAGREWIRTDTFVEDNPTEWVPLTTVRTPYLVLGDWFPLLACLFFVILLLQYLARGWKSDPYRESDIGRFGF